MPLYTNACAAAVERVFLIGPEEEGLALARRLYAPCEPPDRAPDLLPLPRRDRDFLRQLFDPLCPTGVLLFGKDAAEDYDALLDLHPWVRVLRLLPPDAPPPRPFFSYHEQIFPYPQTDRDFRILRGWLGAGRPPAPRRTAVLPGQNSSQ